MSRHLHFLGICGTFMGSLAQLARELGYRVTGTDLNVYPPMSDQLAAAGIDLEEGWDPGLIPAKADCIIIGNALSRGNPAVEHVLERGLPYASGPQWLSQQVLTGRQVIAVSGTHGKTSTSSMAAHILTETGFAPGYLIGGVPGNFEQSAQLGTGAPFVIEADEYDTAFFDKRAKFVHYQPRVAVLNNLEFDHADIYPDLAAIQTQFHHLLRLVPAGGTVVYPTADEAIRTVIERGCWSRTVLLGPGQQWRAEALSEAGRTARFCWPGGSAELSWNLLGQHNLDNALAAVAACCAAGADPAQAVAALSGFRLPRRRLELLAHRDDIRIYDDFAHHPTAIAATLSALAGTAPGRLLVVLEPRSNTMRLGHHREELPTSLAAADHVWLRRAPGLTWEPENLTSAMKGRLTVVDDLDPLPATLMAELKPGDRLIFMSNGGFEGIAQRTARNFLEQPR